MLYIVVPLYVIFFAAMLYGAFSMRANPALRPFSVYLFAGAIGTLVGFVLVNGLVLLAGAGPVWLAENLGLPKFLQSIVMIFAEIVLFFGPLFGSVIGVLIGFAAGIGIVNWRTSRAFPKQSYDDDPIDRVDSSDDVIEAEFK
jgi:hypothetical protein